MAQLSLWDDAEGPGERIPIFRPIHYLGSKLRIVDEIRWAVDELDPHGTSACDLFAGSGTVSLALGKERQLVSADIQEYSRVLCSALLLPSVPPSSIVEGLIAETSGGELATLLRWCFQPLSEHEDACLRSAARGHPEALCDLVESGSQRLYALGDTSVQVGGALDAALTSVSTRLKEAGLQDSPETVLSRHYGGVYFSYEQAVTLDAAVTAISGLPDEYHDTLLASIVSVASETVNTVGKHFAQPIRPRTKNGNAKVHLVRQIERDRTHDISTSLPTWIERYSSLDASERGHRVVRADYRDVLSSLDDVGVVYADPPYTRDHYSRFYHVLETICLRDDPGVSRVTLGGEERPSRGIYRRNRHQSPFCIASQVEGAFRGLFAGVVDSASSLVLSYSPSPAKPGARQRVMTLDTLVSLADRYFGSVESRVLEDFSHSKLNSAKLNAGVSYGAEVLLLCRR